MQVILFYVFENRWDLINNYLKRKYLDDSELLLNTKFMGEIFEVRDYN